MEPYRRFENPVSTYPSYSFGFNGQERKDDYEATPGAHNHALYWEYDTRTGRRWNMDPKPNASWSNYSAFANDPIFHFDVSGDTPQISTRIIGGLKAIGGSVEMVAGGIFGGVTSETVAGAIAGWGVAVHGSDVASHGLTELFTGEETRTFTSQIVSKTLQVTGISKDKADNVADYVDAGISIVGTMGVAAPRVDALANNSNKALIRIAKAEIKVKTPAPGNIVKPLISSDMGRIIGWGEGQEGAETTIKLAKTLTKEGVDKMKQLGLTKEWVQTQLDTYSKAIEKGGAKLKNTNLLPRKELMQKILDLWDNVKK